MTSREGVQGRAHTNSRRQVYTLSVYRLTTRRGVRFGVNRLGVDNNQLVYSGHSTAIDALGKVMIHFDEGKEKIKTIVVDKQHITETRRKFRFYVINYKWRI